jgi:hypothetical protein
VFFSFHYERDVTRAAVVRNSWVTHDRQEGVFFDAGIWEEAKKKGDAAIKKMIDDALTGTSVTTVLIGSDTANRRWVKYEIDQSIARGRGLLGVRIHGIKDFNGRTEFPGANPLPARYGVYDWVLNDGYNNFAKWVEEAARAAGR